MDKEKRQKIYKVIMLVVIVATITFVTTTLVMYQYLGNNVKYIAVTTKDDEISATLASFRKIIDQKYLGEIDEDSLMESTIKGYVNGLGDPYTEYMTKEEMEEFTTDVLGNFIGIGIYVAKDTQTNEIVIISPIKDTPAAKAGILSGDVIKKVDGVAYDDLTEATNKIKGEEGTTVSLEIERDGTTLNFDIVRETIKINHVESEVLENNIGYIEFYTFDEGCADEFKEQLESLLSQNITSLIIDIRDNGGGIVSEAIQIADYIVEKGNTLLITTDKNNNEEITVATEDPIVNMPIVMLINGGSASASEILAGALKDNGKVTIVGEKSYGKGVIQELLTLTDGSGLKITTEEYYTPNRNKINGIGITPDVEIEMSDEEIENAITNKKSDTQLQKAIEILKNK